MAKKASQAITTTEFTKRVKQAAAADPSERVDALRQAKLEPPLLFIGGDALRLRRSIEWFAESIGGSSLQVQSFRGGEITSAARVTEIQRELGSRDLFSSQKLLVIYEADRVRAAQAKPLAESIKGADASALVIAAGESVSRNTPLLTYLQPVGTTVNFKHLTEKETVRWIEREVENCGAAGIAADAAEFLAKNFGPNLSALTNEVHKAALLAQPGEKVSLKHVKNLLLQSPEYTSAELMQQIAACKPVNVKRLVQNLIEHGMHPLQISAALTRSLRALLASKDAAPGTAPDEWLVKKLGPKARALSEAQLVEALEELCRLDQALKGSPLADALELDFSTQKLAAHRSGR